MVKYLVMDVDGSLTDGKIYMGSNGEVMKAFSIKDGYVINYILKPVDIVPVIITARTSSIVQNRCDELGIKEIHQGKIDKFNALMEIIGENQIGECAYFGDDIIDLKCMIPIKESGGVVGCPADAVQEVKAVADYICINKAGEGALREFAEWIVKPHVNEVLLNKRIDQAIKYIKCLDKNELKTGVHYVSETFYYFVQEYDTKDRMDCKLESHRKHVDIQWIVEGEEELNVTDISGLKLDIEYSEEADIMFWEPKRNMMRMILTPGAYVVLYPQNAYMGCISVNSPVKVKKIVGKVLYEL